MNRRELIGSIAGIVGTAGTGVCVAAQTSNAKPLVVVHTQKLMNPIQLDQARHDLKVEGDRCGCQIALVPNCDGVVMTSDGHQGKYGFTEKLDSYSISVFCQTAEELREWMPRKTA